MLPPDANDPPCKKDFLKSWPNASSRSSVGKVPGYKLWCGDIPPNCTSQGVHGWVRPEWDLLECVVKTSSGKSDDKFACFTFKSKEGCKACAEALAAWRFKEQGNRFMKPKYVCYTEQR